MDMESLHINLRFTEPGEYFLRGVGAPGDPYGPIRIGSCNSPEELRALVEQAYAENKMNFADMIDSGTPFVATHRKDGHLT